MAVGGVVHVLPLVMPVVAMVAGMMRRRSVVLLSSKQATERAHGPPVLRTSGRKQAPEGPAVTVVTVVTVVMGRRCVMMTVAGLLLALDLVLHGIGQRGTGCSS